MLKRNHKDIKSFCEVCFTLAVKIPKLRYWYMLVHSAESCVIPPFFFYLLFLVFPLSLETCNPPSWHPSRDNTRFYDDTLESGRLKISNINPWKPVTYKNCVSSTECVLIDIIVTISVAVVTGCNFPHGEVGTKSRHIKAW